MGVDVADASDVAASVARFGDRYLHRIYTEDEIADCRGRPAASAPASSAPAAPVPAVWARSLAARFAAKEATMKVLRPSGVPPAWRSIEVRRSSGGWPEMHLHGDAELLAATSGVVGVSVSLSHHDDLATAVVVAVCQPHMRSDQA